LVAQIARAWPELKIAVVAVKVDDVAYVHRQLVHHRVDASVVSSQSHPANVARVVVTTYLGLGYTAQYDLPGFQCFSVNSLELVIVMDALDAVTKKPYECLQYLQQARFLGFLPPGATPAPLERDLMTSLFGFDELVLPQHGHHERHVEVAVVRAPGCKLSSQNSDILQVKRRGIWHHHSRNRRIAGLVSAISRRDSETLQREYPSLPQLSQMSMGMVVVIVENVEHALALAEDLPDAALWFGPTFDLQGLTRRQRQLAQAGLNHPLATTAIVTATRLPEMNLREIGCVVRADGGVGLPNFNDDARAQLAGDQRPLLLIDVEDRHHPQLRHTRQRRRDAYQERGWYAVGVDPVTARVERFLQEHVDDDQSAQLGGRNQRRRRPPLEYGQIPSAREQAAARVRRFLGDIVE
jgi:hypothetical protein